MQRVTSSVLVCLGVAAAASAQCTNPWLPGSGLAGIDGPVNASIAWDPDGAGPQSPRIVFGGSFHIAGNVVADNIAIYDPATAAWSALGSGTDGAVTTLAIAPNGDLIVGGAFFNAGGIFSPQCARWNGSWLGLGTGPSFHGTRTLLVRANGEIWVPTFQHLNRWDGSSWTTVGPAFPASTVYSIAELPNGNLLVGGDFDSIGGVTAYDLAQWDGTTWSPFAGGLPGNGGSFVTPGQVNCVRVLANGDVLVAGSWNSGSSRFIARWDGVQWNSYPSNFSNTPTFLSVQETTNGDLIACGQFYFPSGGTDLARWNGSTWAPYGGSGHATDTIFTFTLLGSDTYIGGNFIAIDSVFAKNAARWDGSTWQFLGAGTSDPVEHLAVAPNGDVIAAGVFGAIEGQTTQRVARWNGTSWLPMPAPSSAIYALLVRKNGDVLIGGSIATTGGPARVARWNGTAWDPFGTGWPQSVYALFERSDGTVAAGGVDPSPLPFQTIPTVGIWNGTSTTTVALPATTLIPVSTMGERPDGALLAAVGPTVYAYHGTSTSTFATVGVFGSVKTIATTPSGQLLLGGTFGAVNGVNASGIARWNGATWSPLGAGVDVAKKIVVLPNGDLVVAGATTAGGSPVNGIARWNGASWSTFGTGLQGGSGPMSLAMTPQGQLFVGGHFTTAGSLISTHLARLGTTCPATAAPFGSGCGTNTLTALTPPWVDATFRAVGTGLPTTSVAITVTSLSAVVPGLGMDLVYPMGVPGCDLFVAPDILGLAITTTGTAETSFFLPNTPPLVGVTFYHQWIPWEITAGIVTSITATNALQLTAGAF